MRPLVLNIEVIPCNIWGYQYSNWMDLAFEVIDRAITANSQERGSYTRHEKQSQPSGMGNRPTRYTSR